VLESRRRGYCYKIVLTAKPDLHEYAKRKNVLDDGMRTGNHHTKDRYATTLSMRRLDLVANAYREQMSHQNLKSMMRQSSCLMTTTAMMKVHQSDPHDPMGKIYLVRHKLCLQSWVKDLAKGLKTTMALLKTS